MRLNFSGAGEDQIREGIRRIGEVIKEQVALYGTLTGAPAQAPPRHDAPADSAESGTDQGGRVVELPRRAERDRRARRS
jgi:2-aminoadipate transaminase